MANYGMGISSVTGDRRVDVLNASTQLAMRGRDEGQRAPVKVQPLPLTNGVHLRSISFHEFNTIFSSSRMLAHIGFLPCGARGGAFAGAVLRQYGFAAGHASAGLGLG